MTQLMPPRPTPISSLQRPHQPILSESLLAEARSNTFGDVAYDGEPDPAEEVLAKRGDWMPMPDHGSAELLVGRRL